MEIVKIEISKLKPLERNVRKHNQRQIDEMIRSVEQFGQTRPIVCDEQYNVLVGNCLYMALVKMGETHADCLVKKGLTDIEKKKLVLADNKLYTMGMDDYENINAYISEIVNSGDLDIVGFDEDTLKVMTMSFSEGKEVLDSYGTIQSEQFRADMPSEVSVNAGQVQQVQTQDTAQATVDVARNTESKRKYVTCPNCGEVIYLD